MSVSSNKPCVILLAMGGPATIDDVPEYLFNIFSDRHIIKLPGGPLAQKPFARMISKRRAPSVQEHYREIGGGSPLMKWTEAQRDNIVREFENAGTPLPCYIGMRYVEPFTDQVIAEAYRDGCRRMIFLPMYPQFCRATTGSSFAVAKTTLKKYRDVEPVFIDDFHDNEVYVGLLKDYIDSNIRDDETLLYSAHSIPQKFVDDGDPYVDQVRKTAAAAAGDREYFLSFQSRTGPVKWVGPETIAETTRLVQEGLRPFVVPISFVCDHIETLHEIDIELKEVTGAGDRLRRMPMFNDDPRFGRMLANLIREAAHVG